MYAVRAACDVTFGVLAHGRPGDSLSSEPLHAHTYRHQRRRRSHARPTRPRLSLLLANRSPPPLPPAGAIVHLYLPVTRAARSSHALETHRTEVAGGGGRRLLPRFSAATAVRWDPARRRDAVPQYPRAPKYLRSALVRVCYVR